MRSEPSISNVQNQVGIQEETAIALRAAFKKNSVHLNSNDNEDKNVRDKKIEDLLEEYKFEAAENIFKQINAEIADGGRASGSLISSLIDIYSNLYNKADNLLKNKDLRKELINMVVEKLTAEPEFYFKLTNSFADGPDVSCIYSSVKTNFFGNLVLVTNSGEVYVKDAAVLAHLQVYRGLLPGAEVQKSTEQFKNQPNLLETLESAKLNQINRALASIAKKIRNFWKYAIKLAL